FSRSRLVDDDGRSAYGDSSNDLDDNDETCSETDGGLVAAGEDWNSALSRHLSLSLFRSYRFCFQCCPMQPVVLARRVHAEGDGIPRVQVIIRRRDKETFEDEDTLRKEERKVGHSMSDANKKTKKTIQDDCLRNSTIC
ncbi:hypothetical protein PFISCL1PPCAC_16710, partial [Pristionchus fissidentatus]